MRALACFVAISLVACSDSSAGSDGAVMDATADVSSDDTSMPTDASEAGTDAAPDAIVDASTDALMDGAPDAAACECSTGPCCDGCHYRGASYACLVVEPFPRTCGGTSTHCGMRALGLTISQVTTFCNGTSSGCDGLEVDTSYGVNCSEPTPGDFQQFGVCIPADGPTAAHCALNCGF